MNTDDDSKLLLAHVDTPTSQAPCLLLTQSLLYYLATKNERAEVQLPRFCEFVITELEITRSAYWCFEEEVFLRLVCESEAYLLAQSNLLTEQSQDLIIDSINLLKHMGKARKNIEFIPGIYKKLEDDLLVISGLVQHRIYEKFRNPEIQCPSCNKKFSQIEFNVVRAMFTVECPQCDQLIAL